MFIPNSSFQDDVGVTFVSVLVFACLFVHSSYLLLSISIGSPVGSHCISKEDYSLIKRKGLAVVDCSWARLGDVPFAKLRCAAPRLRMNFISVKITLLKYHNYYGSQTNILF